MKKSVFYGVLFFLGTLGSSYAGLAEDPFKKALSQALLPDEIYHSSNDEMWGNPHMIWEDFRDMDLRFINTLQSGQEYLEKVKNENITGNFQKLSVGYFVTLILTNDYSGLEKLFLKPDLQTWKTFYSQLGFKPEHPKTAVDIVQDLNGLKKYVQDKLQNALNEESYPYVSSNPLTYLPAFIDKALIQIFSGCWGIRKANPDENLDALRKIVSDIGKDQKFFQIPKEDLIEQSQNPSAPTDHLSVVQNLLQQGYDSCTVDENDLKSTPFVGFFVAHNPQKIVKQVLNKISEKPLLDITEQQWKTLGLAASLLDKTDSDWKGKITSLTTYTKNSDLSVKISQYNFLSNILFYRNADGSLYQQLVRFRNFPKSEWEKSQENSGTKTPYGFDFIALPDPLYDAQKSIQLRDLEVFVRNNEIPFEQRVDLLLGVLKKSEDREDHKRVMNLSAVLDQMASSYVSNMPPYSKLDSLINLFKRFDKNWDPLNTLLFKALQSGKLDTSSAKETFDYLISKVGFPHELIQACLTYDLRYRKDTRQQPDILGHINTYYNQHKRDKGHLYYVIKTFASTILNGERTPLQGPDEEPLSLEDRIQLLRVFKDAWFFDKEAQAKIAQVIQVYLNNREIPLLNRSMVYGVFQNSTFDNIQTFLGEYHQHHEHIARFQAEERRGAAQQQAHREALAAHRAQNFVYSQNVHDPLVVESITANLKFLKKQVILSLSNFDEVKKQIVNAINNLPTKVLLDISPEEKHSALEAIKHLAKDNLRNALYGYGENQMTIGDILVRVWYLISQLTDKREEGIKSLAGQLATMNEKGSFVCATGKVTRLIQALQPYYPEICISQTTEEYATGFIQTHFFAVAKTNARWKELQDKLNRTKDEEKEWKAILDKLRNEAEEEAKEGSLKNLNEGVKQIITHKILNYIDYLG